MTNNILNILWIENDDSVLSAYPAEAELYGLQLSPFECWDDAKKALDNDYDKWDAIILDAKCKKHSDSADNAAQFLVETTNGLTRLYTQHNRHINWYVLSGGSEEEINDLIPDDRKKWDSDWPKKYYSKNTDRIALYQRIRKHTEHSRSSATQIRTILYRNVFNAITESNLDENVSNLMVELLLPLHFGNISDTDFNYRFKNVRQIIEYIFKSMVEQGILPDALYSNRSGKQEINLSWSSLFLSGKPIPNSGLSTTKIIFPKVLSDNVKNMIFVTGAYLHIENKDEKSQRIHEYLQMTGTSYLIRSYALQLCDFILWYNSYLKDNPNRQTNQTYWKLDKTKSIDGNSGISSTNCAPSSKTLHKKSRPLIVFNTKFSDLQTYIQSFLKLLKALYKRTD